MTRANPLDPELCRILVLSKRWQERVQEEGGGCFLWVGYVDMAGYGQVSIKRRAVYAHRVSLVASLGRDLAEGMQAGHFCHDIAFVAGECFGGASCIHRRCVNPNHLEEQSARENILSGNTITAELASRTHCPQGHELVGENLISSALGRRCLVCNRNTTRQRDAVISVAHKLLGITRREYLRLYGHSRFTAEAIVRDLTQIKQTRSLD